MDVKTTEAPAFKMRRGGYDPAEVDAYIGRTLAEISRLQATIEYMSQDVASLREMAKYNEQSEAVVGRALLSASQHADEIVAKAKQQAQEMVDEANRILRDAQVQADRAAREQLRHLEQLRRELEQDVADLRAARTLASADWLRTVAQLLLEQADELVKPLADQEPGPNFPEPTGAAVSIDEQVDKPILSLWSASDPSESLPSSPPGA